MFRFWGSQEQQAQPRPQEGSSHSWYPPPAERPHSPSQVSPSEAAGIIALLRDKSVDELRKLLSDKDAYNQFLLSVNQVKIQNNIRDELRKETLQLARNNLDKEPQMMELRNQCQIIRTTELAAALEKLNDLESQKEEILKFYSPASFINRLQDAINETDKESDMMNKQLLDQEIDIGTFVQKYKKLRTSYHRRALIHLAAKTSPIA
ncbi:vacuolar protein-sorting-associated protein 37 homolog 1-like isoform X2 [Hibiscus syriacus]|uniref:vacuolar protein-sorting-associated protein 37 homolog 1-like isoform X2 n=1 Tax=Hibiscus syriacus TaxID=106335 RepID=UPI001920F9A2|nr:vacuolar protein-sorting-associated protein 37 homolog 1-like isoform X2 [Hibiscus syriacus]